MQPVRRFIVAIGTATCLAIATPARPVLQGPRGGLTIATTELPELREVDEIIDRMLRIGDLQNVQRVEDTLIPGRSHERLAQYHHGVRVFGADVTRQTEHGLTTSIFGRLHTNVELDTTPTLSADDARAVVGMRPGVNVAPSAQPELVIVHADTGRYRLAYRARAFSSSGPTVHFVDAHTGSIIREYNDLKTQIARLACNDCAVGLGRGVKGDHKKISVRATAGVFRADDALRPPLITTYDMRGDWQRTLDVLEGLVPLVDADLASDEDNDWLDGANVDGHVGAGWTYDYLFDRFGRRGLDGNDSPIVTLVHPTKRSDLLDVPSESVSLFHLNAFFCPPSVGGACGPHGMVVYSEGLPPGFVLSSTRQSVDFFAAALDVVAHELAHAVTSFTSKLIYQNESGALNEAFSDIVGTGVEFFIAESGRHQPEQPDYLIGEDVLKPGGMRSLVDPRSLGDPDHYSVRFLGNADNGGVHTNSLIAAHAFYLAIEGGENRTSGITVTGVGANNRAKIERVFFRAFTMMLPADATFAIARSATIQSARDLFGAGSATEQAAAAAWTAVGTE